MIESKTKLADAAVAAQIRKGEHERAGVESAQKSVHAEELHQERMAQERAKTAQAEKQAKAPLPKPSGGKKG
jgi:hypothetical protein